MLALQWEKVLLTVHFKDKERFQMTIEGVSWRHCYRKELMIHLPMLINPFSSMYMKISRTVIDRSKRIWEGFSCTP